MRKRTFTGLTATLGTLALLAGCAPPTQESCALNPNQTATGALLGAGVGTAIGALASNGSGGGMLAGAAVGLLVGAAIGQQQDQACYRLALATAFQQAEAERQAYEAEMARYAQEQAAAQAQAEADARAAAARRQAQARAKQAQAEAETAAQTAEVPKPAPQYKAVGWRNSNTGNGGMITPTNNFTDQATGRNCWSFEDRPIKPDGTSGPPVTRQACMGADGNVVPAN